MSDKSEHGFMSSTPKKSAPPFIDVEEFSMVLASPWLKPRSLEGEDLQNCHFIFLVDIKGLFKFSCSGQKKCWARKSNKKNLLKSKYSPKSYVTLSTGPLPIYVCQKVCLT